MRLSEPLAGEVALATKFALACLIAFFADITAFRIGLDIGLGARLARVAALFIALQVSFALSRWLVFGVDRRGPIFQEWGRFMLANGLGSFCNLSLFVSLLALKAPVISGRWTALVISSSLAYFINYAGTRLFVYGRSTLGPRPGTAIEVVPGRSSTPDG
jgi:putative flippase GtrA